MSIDDLVTNLGRLPGAHVGRGPLHPTEPRPELDSPVTGFLESYPFLQRDAGYVDFIQKYAGVMMTHPEEEIGVDIMGFDPGVANLLEMEGPVVDSHGFLLIAMCSYGTMTGGELSTWEYDFAFDATGSRRDGIYRLVADGGVTLQQFEWHKHNFEQWLVELVDRGGRYERPLAR
jgi:hypothetical protein